MNSLFKIPLTKRYIPAISLIAFFTIFSHILINKITNSSKELAKIINISGKQRMYSQQLIILGRDYYENSFKKPALEKALDFLQNLR